MKLGCSLPNWTSYWGPLNKRRTLLITAGKTGCKFTRSYWLVECLVSGIARPRNRIGMPRLSSLVK